MRGTGAVVFGKDLVYAYFSIAGNQARVRVSADDADRLDLFPGKHINIRLGDGEPSRALVTDVSPVPPFVWVEMELLTAVTSRAG